MDKEKIKQQENANDGQSIFLYYDELAGKYLAYGLSAYYTTMITEPDLSFSEEMGLPVALIKRDQIKYMRGGNLTIVQHKQKTFYHFLMRYHVGDAGYEKWLKRNFPEYVDED